MPEIPYGFCHCGCGEKTKLASRTAPVWGWVKGKPLRYIRFHHTRKPADRHRVDEKTGCWLWEGATNPDGYGMVWSSERSKAIGAHRAYYMRYIGPIPNDYQLDHLCRTPLCVNPDHLEPVTQAENVRRGATPKLSEKAAAFIRLSPASAPTLAQKYGVTESAIYQVRRGEIWR